MIERQIRPSRLVWEDPPPKRSWRIVAWDFTGLALGAILQTGKGFFAPGRRARRLDSAGR